ncbi:DUF4041 domain-containing protein [Vibrio atlanticus]|jgi:hypothetical protein|uniref:DUF4041 domain-containing protein n=2 Tax=Vibrio TaxID=662 RepID=A0ABV4KWR1_9VIBR
METSVIVTLTIFFLPLILLVILHLRSKKKRKEFEEQLSIANQKISNIENEKDTLLKKYAPVIDMELHANRLLDEATEEATSIRFQAEGVLSETEELRNETRKKLNEAKEKAEIIKNDAREESAKVLSFAEAQAKEIAGNAYEAKAKADSYEKAIRAMRNTIDGYKDDYIIPNQSVLDDLAEEYSYKEAGEELKVSHKRVKAMVKEGHAGACDYVEAHRKTYAIHFAVDAFNGKVDSALSKTKHDNFGKIQQEIIDAFALVNHNGAPFRNARIKQEYLDARLTELKWAVAAFELRKIEKEEKMLQKALEKARSELDQASEEQRAVFEAQLAELESKLQEAEEKGQRALSMAQQTRRGHVYVISNVGSFGEEVFKIGMTRRLEPMDRVKELGDASVPFSFDVHAMIYSDDAPSLEKELHKKFNEQSVNKINPRKEFFKTTIAEVKQAAEQQGLHEVHWTLKAEAAEFRESLAIAKEQQAVA